MLLGAARSLSTVPFTKVESVGNDFVLIDSGSVQVQHLPSFARLVSARHFSVGSDGLLVAGMEDGVLQLHMFNPDGSEDFCGNGLRCAAIYAHEKGWTGVETEISHLGRAVLTRIVEPGIVRSALAPADFSPSAVPLRAGAEEMFLKEVEVASRSILLSAVTTGSTHTVVLAEHLPEDDEFFEVGPLLEFHPLFPERTSVIWAVADGEDALRIRIWERGAGETQGCGTGSSAAAAVHFRARRKHGSITVHNPGGPVQVEMEGWEAPIFTEAKAEVVFTGTVSWIEPV
jgi:diaminopimelate epimerase